MDQGTDSILFVDFDGVLHPAVAEGEKVRYFEWAETLAEALRGQDRLGLVVHSTGRYVYLTSKLAAMLRPVGVPLLDVVPRGPRHESILWELAAHRVCAANSCLKSFFFNTKTSVALKRPRLLALGRRGLKLGLVEADALLQQLRAVNAFSQTLDVMRRHTCLHKVFLPGVHNINDADDFGCSLRRQQAESLTLRHRIVERRFPPMRAADELLISLPRV